MKRVVKGSSNLDSLRVILHNKGLTSDEIDTIIDSIQEMIDNASAELENRIWESIKWRYDE